MKNKLTYSFQTDLKERLKNPAFKKAWKESEVEYLLATQMIEKRRAKKVSQRELATLLHTSQAVISRIETMRANPSLELLKRIAKALHTSFTLRIS